MALPPTWKIKRELWRIREQMSRRITSAFYDPPRQLIYDQTASMRVHFKEGVLPLQRRVAVFVLFQPGSLSRSTFLTLDHLTSNKWSPVVITNAPLNDANFHEVEKRSAVVISRPNVGYDFGAYREGIRFLSRIGKDVDRLLLLNDSTWFPVREADTTLARMEASSADMQGQIFKTESTEKRGRDHLESHLLMFGKDAIEHPAFSRFWNSYLMSDDRTSTVARGEKALSQAMLNSGLQVEGLLSRERLLELLEKLDDEEFLMVMRNVVHHREDIHMPFAKLAQREQLNPKSRTEFLGWVGEVLSNSRQHLLSATFIYPAMRYGNMGFIKKANDRRFHLARRKVLELEGTGLIEKLDPTVRGEIEDAVSVWTPPFDWRARSDEAVEEST